MASPNIFADIVDTKPPPDTIQTRPDHPAPRKGVTSRGPIGTNKFYANFFLENQTTPCYAHPYTLSWVRGEGVTESWGMAISHVDASQRVYGEQDFNGASRYFINPVGIHSLILSAVELGPNTKLTTANPNAFGVMVNLEDGYGSQRTISFPVVQGMGFVTAAYYGATPLLQSGVFFRTLTRIETQPKVGVTKFEAILEDSKKWLIYAISSTGRSPNFQLIAPTQIKATSGFHGYIQVAKDPGTGGELYDQAVGGFPLGLRMSGSVKDATGQYSFRWVKAGKQDTSLLMWALPHHVESFDLETKGKVTNLRLQTTTKGIAKAVLADSWTMLEPEMPVNMRFGPWTPDRGNLEIPSSAKMTIYNIARRELSQDMDAQSNKDSMYFAGKTLAKFASLVYTVSELLGDREMAAPALASLKTAFSRFASNTQQHALVYEKGWGGVVSSATFKFNDPYVDFGNGFYNDHHFHYGYHILAGAVIAYLDPHWLNEKLTPNSANTNEDYINILVRDVANPSGEDRYFPEWRSFDWYHGHSWAHGLFASNDGKNQESSSEDAMSVYALKMWGFVTRNTNLEARSNLQLSVLARSLQKYYLYTRSNDIQPANFIGNKVAGILFENKIDHTTFFGYRLEYIQGIHMIPLLPCSTLVRTREFVQEEWSSFFSNSRADVDSGWRGILYGNLATVDPAAAWAKFTDPAWDSNRWIDDGASLSWYLAWAAALMGPQGYQ